MELNVISYNTAASACVEGPAVATCCERVVGVEPPLLRPNLITDNAATSACEKGLRWQHDLSVLLGRIQVQHQNVITYNAATVACERACSGNMF